MVIADGPDRQAIGEFHVLGWSPLWRHEGATHEVYLALEGVAGAPPSLGQFESWFFMLRSTCGTGFGVMVASATNGTLRMVTRRLPWSAHREVGRVDRLRSRKVRAGNPYAFRTLVLVLGLGLALSRAPLLELGDGRAAPALIAALQVYAACRA